MTRIAVRLLLVLALAVALLLPAAAAADAHTQKNVGAYQFTVGWGAEPAYAGQLNSVQLVLATLSTGKPYTQLTDTLKVTVVYAQQHVDFALTPTFDPDTGVGTPGDYRAWFFPTAPGNYTFHFTGTIGSQQVDQSFTSSPTTFATVEDPAGVQFPMKAPSNAQLAARIGADSARTATQSQVSSARTLGLVGIVVGVIGIAVATVALVRKRA
jgi:opacity protein-like surface antigen